ncbi:MAG: hypothetical protein ACP5GR_06515, partial [Thermoplasmata archaeon]
TLYQEFGHNMDKISPEGLRLFLEKELRLKELKERGDSVSNGMVYIRILEDLGEVADVDTDYILRKEDIVSVSLGLADILISQGKAERMEVGK